MRVPLSVRDFLDRAARRLRRPVRDRRRAPPACAVAGRADLRRTRGTRPAPKPPPSTGSASASGERVAIVSHERGAAVHLVLRRERLGPDPRPDQLPAQRRGGRLHRRALRCPGAARRPGARRGVGRRRRPAPARARRRGARPSSARTAIRRRGRRTRTRPRRSTTRAGRRRARRGCSSPTATCGSTRRRSAGTSA